MGIQNVTPLVRGSEVQLPEGPALKAAAALVAKAGPVAEAVLAASTLLDRVPAMIREIGSLEKRRTALLGDLDALTTKLGVVKAATEQEIATLRGQVESARKVATETERTLKADVERRLQGHEQDMARLGALIEEDRRKLEAALAEQQAERQNAAAAHAAIRRDLEDEVEALAKKRDALLKDIDRLRKKHLGAD